MVTWCTTFNDCKFCRHCIVAFCIYLKTNSDLCHLQHKLIGFITEMKSVYSAVRTGSLNKSVCASSFRTNSDLCHLQHKLIGFITEMKSVYCAVRSGPLNRVVCHSSVKGSSRYLKIYVIALENQGRWVHTVITLSPVVWGKLGLFFRQYMEFYFSPHINQTELGSSRACTRLFPLFSRGWSGWILNFSPRLVLILVKAR